VINNNNNNNILSECLYNLFSRTARGITYWRKHKHHICYKCRRYGHIAKDCPDICDKCGNLHNNTVCVHSMEKHLRKISEILEKNLIGDTEKIIKKIQETEQRIQIENTKEAMKNTNRQNILKVATSSSFTIEKQPKKQTDLDTLFDDMELQCLGIPGVTHEIKRKMKKPKIVKKEEKPKIEDNTTKDYKAIKELTEKIIEFKKQNLDTKIFEELRAKIENNIGFIEKSDKITENYVSYFFHKKEKPKLQYPQLAKLEAEVELDNLKEKLKKLQKSKTTLEIAMRAYEEYRKYKKDSDYLFGEIQRLKIDFKNLLEKCKDKKSETYKKISEMYKKFKDEKYKQWKEQNETLSKKWRKFNIAKNDFYNFKKAFENRVEEDRNDRRIHRQMKEEMYRMRKEGQYGGTWGRHYQGNTKVGPDANNKMFNGNAEDYEEYRKEFDKEDYGGFGERTNWEEHNNFDTHFDGNDRYEKDEYGNDHYTGTFDPETYEYYNKYDNDDY